jgi:hypothetical protein
MSIPAILGPLFVQVALTVGLLFWMGYARVTTISRGETKIRDIALREPNWPTHSTQIANAYHNQFELPVLFYVLVVLAIITRQADLLFVAMSWIFVALRLVHAYIMVTSNYVPRRFQIHFVALVILVLMWIIFAFRILINI